MSNNHEINLYNPGSKPRIYLCSSKDKNTAKYIQYNADGSKITLCSNSGMDLTVKNHQRTLTSSSPMTIFYSPPPKRSKGNEFKESAKRIFGL